MRSLPEAVRHALRALDDGEAVAPIDLALARLVAGLDAEHGAPDPARARTLALSTALVSHARRDGHSAVALADYAGAPFPGETPRGLPHLPALDDWRRALEASPTVGGADAVGPLVFDGDRLALRRFASAERRLAAALAARLAPLADAPSEAARAAFAALFPSRADGGLDRQALAAAAALRQRVLFVAGGPGTGKTYTAARLLALVLADAPATRLALAAPTGKAAARLAESITGALAAVPDALAAPVPTEAVTLHRLLGASPHRSGYRHDARRPLPHDLVLVDEGSMVDLPLFDALLAALRPQARLVVLGDPDQLAPVEAGTPFADVCALAEGDPPPGLAAFGAALGLPGIPADPDAPPLAAALVRLTESRRFTADSDVGALARAIQAADAGAALAALEGDREDVTLAEADPAAAALTWALPFARAVVAAEAPTAALAALDAFRLLAAVRRGPRGVEGLNAAVEGALRAEGRVRWNPYAEPFYHGRPVLVTVNDPDTGLANGDIGVCWTLDGERVVAFPGRPPVPLVRLPAHEPAWALTIHKSQGSEFDAVGAVLPEPDTRGAGLLTRELLYTAATRARQRVAIFGGREQVSTAVATRQRRTSGLADRLAGA